MVTAQRDYYEVLGVPRDATPDQIKDAFRGLAFKFHPDRSKEADAEERFKEIAEAYAILSDPNKRADYDARGHASVAGFSPEDFFSDINMEDLFRGMDFGFGNGVFDRFFHRRPRGPAKGSDVETTLGVTLERVLKGGEENVRIVRPQPCSVCKGSRTQPGSTPRKCGNCDGSGNKVSSKRKKRVHFQTITTCTACGGDGIIIDKPCQECHGQGQVDKEDSLTVTVPVGVEEGTALRIPHYGLPSAGPNGPPGDLYVVIHTIPDRRFQRRGADLWRSETVQIADAVLGTKIRVPTLEGRTTVRVPPGTQPDDILRLRGKGLPRYASKKRGDLNIHIRVHIPERLSRDERRLFEQLRRSENS
ncbi:MAG: DnaJ domain-containing protein [Gammaproteobacteria bacterium]|nr:DnaJ domain-containing protein [Gammaproteobacteria bacterium]